MTFILLRMRPNIRGWTGLLMCVIRGLFPLDLARSSIRLDMIWVGDPYLAGEREVSCGRNMHRQGYIDCSPLGVMKPMTRRNRLSLFRGRNRHFSICSKCHSAYSSATQLCGSHIGTAKSQKPRHSGQGRRRSSGPIIAVLHKKHGPGFFFKRRHVRGDTLACLLKNEMPPWPGSPIQDHTRSLGPPPRKKKKELHADSPLLSKTGSDSQAVADKSLTDRLIMLHAFFA
ncbi:hypothetical protein LZ31DRAFT_316972 [Colletotrichum somersetense]|nr:hypothetical protein LZ31DRAFT_316972 [Colletotrichum somersetense]